MFGFKCNFACAHCCSPDASAALNPREESLLLDAVESHGMKTLHFLGGEPTLYLDRTNAFLSKLGKLNKFKVKITTNGHFAKTKSSAVTLLSSFKKLDSVQLSYDKFHKKFLPFSYIRNLHNACRSLNIGFGVVASVQSPMDMLLLNKLKDIGDFQIGMQKVLPVGRARSNRIFYQHPSFDRNVLSRRCPNKKVITCLPEKGFSICCSSLVFDTNIQNICHPTLKAHLDSEFYRMMRSLSFRGIIKKFGLNMAPFLPEDSAPCVLCEKVFRKLTTDKKTIYGS